MKSVKVQYAVAPEYTQQNKENIRLVMTALQKNPIDGLHYAAFTIGDGDTFVHINMARSADVLAKFTELPQFKSFQAALRASKPVSKPDAVDMALVAAGFEI